MYFEEIDNISDIISQQRGRESTATGDALVGESAIAEDALSVGHAADASFPAITAVVAAAR